MADTYKVQPGDTLSGIARDLLGDASLWAQIATVNGLHDPDLIHPGQVLRLPAYGEASAASESLAADTWGAPSAELVMLLPKGWWLSSPYGWRSLPGYDDHHHDGQDYAIGKGTPIMFGVTVVVESCQTFDGYGVTVTLKAGDKRIFLAHLDRVAVNVGQTVAHNAIVAYSGNTGRYTTGAHLHIEVWTGPTQAQHVDPANHLRVETA